MLVAPLSVPMSARSRRVVTKPSSIATSARQAMTGWLAVGLVAIIAIPATRGDAMLGATLPFWLVAAPAINLMWIERRRWPRALAGWARNRISRRVSSRNVRQRAARSFACSAERS